MVFQPGNKLGGPKRGNQNALKHSLTTAGKFRSELSAYYEAKYRCTNPKHKAYPYYGGRGIEFRFANIEEFLHEVGPRPSPLHSIDRINNDGHYEPGNVRWATKKEQTHNRRPYRSNKGGKI
jgi:hypothetical protein